MGFKGGFFFPVSFMLEVGRFFRFVGLRDWGDCGYFKGWMGFMGRVGEESGRGGGRVGEWDSGGAEGRGGEEEEEEEKMGRDGDGERWRWNGVCVYDCTDVNEYTRFTNEKE